MFSSYGSITGFLTGLGGNTTYEFTSPLKCDVAVVAYFDPKPCFEEGLLYPSVVVTIGLLSSYTLPNS